MLILVICNLWVIKMYYWGLKELVVGVGYCFNKEKIIFLRGMLLKFLMDEEEI